MGRGGTEKIGQVKHVPSMKEVRLAVAAATES